MVDTQRQPNQGPILLGNTLSFGIVALIVVLWRISFRLKKKWGDASDLFIAIALVSSIVQEVINIDCVVHWGYGKHKRDLPPHIAKSPTPLMLFWLNQIFFKITTGCCKLSLCIVYLRVFRRANSRLVRVTRLCFYLTAFIVIGAYGSSAFVSAFECNPVSKQWIKSKKGTCISLDGFRLGTATINIVTSVLVIVTPLPALFVLKKHAGREVGEFIFLILLGVVHTSCTVARLILMLYPSSSVATDPQWGNNIPNAVSMVEMNVGLIAASLVVMRAHFHEAFHFFFGPNVHPFSKFSHPPRPSNTHVFFSPTDPATNTLPCTSTSSASPIGSHASRFWERSKSRSRSRQQSKEMGFIRCNEL